MPIADQFLEETHLLRLALPMFGGLPPEARAFGVNHNPPHISYANINKIRPMRSRRTTFKH